MLRFWKNWQARYQIQTEELDTAIAIHSERDLVVSILGFMQKSQGGERFVGGSEILERFAELASIRK